MNNSAYKNRIILNRLEYLIKKMKFFATKQSIHDELLNKANITNINIDELELQKKYDVFRFEEEPKWEFTLKNWS